MREVSRADVVLSGYGPVGRAYVEYLARQRDELAHRHGVRVNVAAVRASSGQCRLREGEPVPPRSAWGPPAPLEETLDRTAADVFVQAIPSSPTPPARRGRGHDRPAQRGACGHGHQEPPAQPLAGPRRSGPRGGRHDQDLRGDGSRSAGGDLSRTSLRGLGCTTIRACPNGTATFVLDRLAAGDSLDEAVREAQRRGIAEADPSSDLSGEDAATKVRLLAALAWGWDRRPCGCGRSRWTRAPPGQRRPRPPGTPPARRGKRIRGHAPPGPRPPGGDGAR
ncbi:homoserine dehydrogenase [Streptomyces sp. INA 01156]